MGDDDLNVKEQLAELQRGLGRIEGKFDSVIVGMKTQEAISIRLENRIRHTEGKQHWLAGAASIGGAVIGFIANWVIYHAPR